jgi:hypothetical protein
MNATWLLGQAGPPHGLTEEWQVVAVLAVAGGVAVGLTVWLWATKGQKGK